MAYSAAAMYGAAGGIDLIERLIPGGPRYSMVPALFALAIVAVLLVVERHLPRWGLAPLGPIAVGLIAYAMSTGPGASDAAIVYICPVLWTVFFFGVPGAISIVACVGVAHGLALLSLGGRSGYFDRWVDVVACVSIVAVFIQMLTRYNEGLLVRLAGEARTDNLTGLLNRRGFEERASVEVAHARRGRGSIAVVAFDIDYFKRVNDEWGHETGDQVLARMGAILNSETREIDVVARFGGEEFTVLIPDADVADADAFTERIRRALAAADASGLPAVHVSAGIAAAVAPTHFEPLLHLADSALYAAKRSGRNRTVTGQLPAASLASALPSP